jgi:hypothetical protein
MASFTIPKNYSVPEGVKENSEFSDIATFKIKGGKIHILTIGEDATPVSSKDGKSEKPKGGKEAIKEQLSAMEDKSGSEEIEDESYEEEGSEEEMD